MRTFFADCWWLLCHRYLPITLAGTVGACLGDLLAGSFGHQSSPLGWAGMGVGMVAAVLVCRRRWPDQTGRWDPW
jgi:hypothetical protein